MGLEIIEIVMGLEEEFALSLSDEKLSGVRTAGDLQRLVEAELARLAAGGGCPTSRAFYRLRGGLVAVTGASRRSLTPDTRLSAVLPRTGRRRRWRQVQQVTSLSLPTLRFPRPVETALAVLALLVWLGPAVVTGLLRLWPLAWGWLFLAGPLVAYVVSAGARLVVEGSVAALPAAGDLTLGELAREIAANWSADDAWERVQAVIVRELHVPPERVTPEADLARDLHAG